jgi:hypothetical protein
MSPGLARPIRPILLHARARQVTRRLCHEIGLIARFVEGVRLVQSNGARLPVHGAVGR